MLFLSGIDQWYLGIGDPAALGPDGHGSVDLQNNNVNPEPTEGPTSNGSSNGPMSTDKDLTVPEGMLNTLTDSTSATLVRERIWSELVLFF